MQNVITVSGSAHEQGVRQGEALRELIAKNVVCVKESLAKSGVDMDFYRAYVARNAKFMEDNHPNLTQEIEGIARGSGLPLDDILALNIPAYFLTRYFGQECSMLLARGAATADGCTYLIKNRDMSTWIEQAVIKRALDSVELVEISGAGTVTYPANGMNSHGLALATTGFWSDDARPDLADADTAHIFVNIRILLEECRTVRDVLERLKAYPRMNGLNIIAADRDEAVVIETTRDTLHVQRDDGSGILYRTNHYLSPDIAHLNPPESEYPSTFLRHARIGRMLAQCGQKLRFQDLWRVMSDHEDGVNGICRHPREEAPAWTASTSMVVLEDLEAFTSLGNPCRSLRRAKLSEKR